MGETVVSVEGLSVQYNGKESTTYAVEDASLRLERGKVLALVGESGSGKSTVGHSILRLLPMQAEITAGRILFDGQDLTTVDDETLRSIRGRRIAMIFQDPISGLNPVISIGDQVGEILESHMGVKRREAKVRAIDILKSVGLPDPERVAKSYPFQLSGGMCQRVMIAIATALNPEVIVADEPTSALDVTVQAQILHQLDQLRHEQGTAILLITHSFGVVAQMADEVSVMYGGRMVEEGETVGLLSKPLHPYSHALLGTLPRLDQAGLALRAIPGAPPDLTNRPEHCPFIPRCNKTMNECRTSPPPVLNEWNGSPQRVACFNPIWQA
ncbi:MAG: ABC transporter ATP-binding protein [Tepidiformaceae bacterium]